MWPQTKLYDYLFWDTHGSEKHIYLWKILEKAYFLELKMYIDFLGGGHRISGMFPVTFYNIVMGFLSHDNIDLYCEI